MGWRGARASLLDAIASLNLSSAAGMEYTFYIVPHKVKVSSTRSAQSGERSFVARPKVNRRRVCPGGCPPERRVRLTRSNSVLPALGAETFCYDETT